MCVGLFVRTGSHSNILKAVNESKKQQETLKAEQKGSKTWTLNKKRNKIQTQKSHFGSNAVVVT